MRGPLYFLAAALVAVAAFWAYNVNYAAKAAQERVASLRQEIAREREAIAVLRAEWAYLAAPDRVRALARANDAALTLSPLAAASYVALDAIPAPPPEAFWARAAPSAFAAAPGGRVAP